MDFLRNKALYELVMYKFEHDNLRKKNKLIVNFDLLEQNGKKDFE